MNTAQKLALGAAIFLPGIATAGDLLDYPGPGYRNQPQEVLSIQEKLVTPGAKSLFKLPSSEQRIDLLQPGKVSLTLEPDAPAPKTVK